MPWYWRWLGLIALAAVGHDVRRFAAYDFGMEFAGFRPERGRPRAAATHGYERKAGSGSLLNCGAKLAQAERQLQIERATYADLVKQVKALTEENAALKEDLAFFQTLMPAGGKDGGVAVNRFLVQPDAAARRVSLPPAAGADRAARQGFSGQPAVGGEPAAGRPEDWCMTLPARRRQGMPRNIKLNFRFYQRVEGTFRVAPDAVVKSMQVRVFESGSNAPKLTQTVDRFLRRLPCSATRAASRRTASTA